MVQRCPGLWFPVVVLVNISLFPDICMGFQLINTGKPPPGSRNQWFICQLGNGFILCCWLQVAGDLVTYYIIAQSVVLYSFSTYTEYCFVFSTYTTCRFVFSTYTTCRFVFSTYPQCRLVFSHTQSVALGTQRGYLGHRKSVS